ncbi:MAG: hypothetical protein MJ248_02335 [Bacilli bacterium]|nr:hypothetical protein [Bacilli bacterium]
MKRTKLIVLAAATMALGLTACGNKNNNKTKSVEEIAAGFETSVAGKLSFNYSAKYKVDVDSHTDNKDAMSSFKHDIDDKVSGEIDLTAGDLYLHIKNEAKDKLISDTAKVKEALVYKNGASYYYLTSTMENPVALASETAASAKIAELVEKVSSNLAGGVTMDTFLYDGLDQEYEYREFGLSSSTVDKSYWEGLTEWSANDNGGIKAVSKPWYIGYKTDAGVSDFSTPEFEAGDEGAYAALIEVNTNDKGYVTAYSENYSNLALDFAIMNPAPTVTIEGSRTFSATYGSDITRLSTINHELTYGTVKLNTSNKGTYEVYTCSADDKATKTKVADEGQVKVGDLLAVKVTPAGSNTVLAVTYGTVSGQLDTDGYYYFEVQEGENAITVNFNGSDENEDAEWATVTGITKGEGVATVRVTYIVYPDVNNMMELDSQGRAPIGASNFLIIQATFEEGYELDAIKVNDATASPFGPGIYGYNIKTAGEFAINVTAKKTSAGPEETADFSWTINSDAGVASVQVMTLDNFDFAGMQDVTAAGKAEAKAGRFICFKVALVTGAEIVSVKIGDTAGNLQGGFYCFDGSVAGSYTVDIVTTKAGEEDTTNYVWNINKDAGVASVQVMTLDNFDFAGMKDVTSAGKAEAKAGRFICFKVTTVEGANVVSVKCGETDGNLQGGFYCFDGSVAGNHTIDIVTDAPAVDYSWTINSDAGVASVQVMTLDNFDFPGMKDVTSAGKAEAKAGRFICFKVTTAAGYAVSSVKIGDTDGNLQGGFYCFDGSVAGSYTVNIVTVAA